MYLFFIGKAGALKPKKPSRKKIKEKASKKFKGHPTATIAYYGPDNKRATKVVVGIVFRDDADPGVLKKWYAETTDDIRHDFKIHREMLNLIVEYKVKSAVIADGIMGCPHEEGIDYPKGEKCPKCPFWSYRDKWSGEPIS